MIVLHKLMSMRNTVVILVFLIGASLDALGFDCAPWVYRDADQSSPTREEIKFAKGLLWNIKHPSGASSYLFGTIHLADPRIVALSRAVAERIAEKPNFAMEVLITPDTVRFSVSRMFFSNGEKLSEQLPSGLYDRTVTLLQQHGVSSALVDSVRPWAAYMTLAVPPSGNGLPLDLHLLNLAQSHGNQLFGVETIEEQLGIFEALDLQQQISLLSESVCNYQENQSQIGTMLSLYLAQDLGGLVEIGDKYQTPVNANLFQKLLIDRNRTMAERIKPWMQQGQFFVAVGALHLPGPTGLLRALENAGFEVSQVELQP